MHKHRALVYILANAERVSTLVLGRVYTKCVVYAIEINRFLFCFSFFIYFILFSNRLRTLSCSAMPYIFVYNNIIYLESVTLTWRRAAITLRRNDGVII